VVASTVLFAPPKVFHESQMIVTFRCFHAYLRGGSEVCARNPIVPFVFRMSSIVFDGFP